MESGQELSCIEHVADDEQYIINTHALHNAARLRCYLPRYLTVPRPLIMNRKEWHVEIVVGLRVTQSAKRTQTQEKAAATRQKNKEKNQGTSATGVSTARKRQHREEMDVNEGMDVDMNLG